MQPSTADRGRRFSFCNGISRETGKISRILPLKILHCHQKQASEPDEFVRFFVIHFGNRIFTFERKNVAKRLHKFVVL